jgi:hypothetical protein
MRLHQNALQGLQGIEKNSHDHLTLLPFCDAAPSNNSLQASNVGAMHQALCSCI